MLSSALPDRVSFLSSKKKAKFTISRKFVFSSANDRRRLMNTDLNWLSQFECLISLSQPQAWLDGKQPWLRHIPVKSERYMSIISYLKQYILNYHTIRLFEKFLSLLLIVYTLISSTSQYITFVNFLPKRIPSFWSLQLHRKI